MAGIKERFTRIAHYTESVIDELEAENKRLRDALGNVLLICNPYGPDRPSGDFARERAFKEANKALKGGN